MIGLGLLGISGKTPFASIGQRALDLLEGHPWFEIRALIADDPDLDSARPEIGKNEISRHQKIKIPVTATQQ